jgi:hypothetical protein
MRIGIVDPEEEVVLINPLQPGKNAIIDFSRMKVPALFGVAVLIIIESLVESKSGFKNTK